MADYSFHDVRVGDDVARLLAGKLLMPLTVTAVDNELIHCGSWTFDRQTGAEVDDDLRWGPQYGRTGSWLVDDELARAIACSRRFVAIDGLLRCCLQTLVDYDGLEDEGTEVLCSWCERPLVVRRGSWGTKVD